MTNFLHALRRRHATELPLELQLFVAAYAQSGRRGTASNSGLFLWATMGRHPPAGTQTARRSILPWPCFARGPWACPPGRAWLGLAWLDYQFPLKARRSDQGDWQGRSARPYRGRAPLCRRAEDWQQLRKTLGSRCWRVWPTPPSSRRTRSRSRSRPKGRAGTSSAGRGPSSGCSSPAGVLGARLEEKALLHGPRAPARRKR